MHEPTCHSIKIARTKALMEGEGRIAGTIQFRVVYRYSSSILMTVHVVYKAYDVGGDQVRP